MHQPQKQDLRLQPDTSVRAVTAGYTPSTEANILDTSATGPQKHNSRREISDKLNEVAEKRNFPELKYYWEAFEKLGIPLEQIPTVGEKAYRPFSIKTPLALTGIGISSVITGAMYADWVLSVGNATRNLTNLSGSTLSALALTFVTNYALATLISRRNYQKHLVMELASALKERNFAQSVNESDAGRSVITKLAALGITEHFDNSRYQRSYLNQKETVDRVKEYTPIASYSEYALGIFRDFAGKKDSATRKFIPGRFFSQIVGGKETLSRFLVQQAAALKLLKEDPTDKLLAINFLNDFKECFASGGAAQKQLELAIEALKSDRQPGQTIVNCQIWERDPLKDLTPSRELFSSLSLRVDRPQFLKSKGKLGEFAMLRNKSMTCLDFRIEGRLINRARMAAAIVKNGDKEIPVLFVDGVEGSRITEPNVIIRAIKDYAEASGFNFIFYNAYPLNTVPKRIVKRVAEISPDKRTVDLEFADASAYQYLDSFCTIQETPFEYARPKGKVTGHIFSLNSHKPEELPSSAIDWQVKAKQLLRQNFSTIVAPTFVSASLAGIGFFSSQYVMIAASALIQAYVWYAVRASKPVD